MTDPKVLADALVEAGIGAEVGWDGRYAHRGRIKLFRIGDELGQHPEVFITDWRVAGKVLELMDASVTRSGSGFACAAGGDWTYGESLPRAIVEAWYEARQ